jgi:hypothetical protein
MYCIYAQRLSSAAGLDLSAIPCNRSRRADRLDSQETDEPSPDGADLASPLAAVRALSMQQLARHPLMRISTVLVTTVLILVAGGAAAQSVRFDEHGFSFRFGRDDPHRDVEGKRATCDVYARIAVIQADANERFRCGLQGPAWTNDPARHFEWCRYVPRQRIAEEQHERSEELQHCFDRLGDFDDDRWGR